jgi:hypothetical protein
VSKGLAAVGAAEALAGTKTYLLKGTIEQWEPEQSITPDGEPRMGNDSTFSLLADVAAGTRRIDWERKYTYPQPRVYTCGEIVTPTAGYVEGIDSTGRNKQSLDADPAAHSMSGLRSAAGGHPGARMVAPRARSPRDLRWSGCALGAAHAPLARGAMSVHGSRGDAFESGTRRIPVLQAATIRTWREHCRSSRRAGTGSPWRPRARGKAARRHLRRNWLAPISQREMVSVATSSRAAESGWRRPVALRVTARSPLPVVCWLRVRLRRRWAPRRADPSGSL